MVKHNGHQVILSLAEVEKILAPLRKAKKKIVLTQGSWDMVHVGHGRYLTEAKKQGDVLLVGADSDEKIRQRKGKGRPVVPQAERLEMLTYFKPVDYVFLKEATAPHYSLIKAVRPDVLVVIEENYTPAALKEIKRYCKAVKILPRMATTSTSAKLREVQIGQAKKMEGKLLRAIEGVLQEFKR